MRFIGKGDMEVGLRLWGFANLVHKSHPKIGFIVYALDWYQMLLYVWTIESNMELRIIYSPNKLINLK